MKKILSQSADDTFAFGARLAKLLQPGDIVCFFGDLGSGKTTMIKGIADGLKIKPKDVHSPTFTLMNFYDHGRIPLYHFDMYRISEPEQLFDIGYEEFLYGNGISAIEWSEKLGRLLPRDRLDIHLQHKDENQRVISITAAGVHYQQLVTRI